LNQVLSTHALCCSKSNAKLSVYLLGAGSNPEQLQKLCASQKATIEGMVRYDFSSPIVIRGKHRVKLTPVDPLLKGQPYTLNIRYLIAIEVTLVISASVW